jgi:hypothetical protein
MTPARTQLFWTNDRFGSQADLSPYITSTAAVERLDVVRSRFCLTVNV